MMQILQTSPPPILISYPSLSEAARSPHLCTMETPLLLLITLCTAKGAEGYETRNLYAEMGSSVFFPDVKSDSYTYFELTRDARPLLVYHDVWKVRTKRGQYFPGNETFLLRNLTVEDSGTYKYRINMTIVKIKVDLRVIDPLPEPVLVIEGVKGDGSQCLVNITCRAESTSPVNVKIQRNKEIIDNVTVTGGSHSLSLDAWNTSGSVTCIVQNEIASKTSSPIELPLPATPEQEVMVLIAMAFLVQWAVAVLYNLYQMCCTRKNWWEWRRRRNDFSREESQASLCGTENPSDFSTAFSLADNLFGFFKEVFAVWSWIYGSIAPWWCSLLAASCLLCRIIFWTMTFINLYGKQTVNSFFKVCGLVMFVSSYLGVPAFSVAVITIFYTRHPCGMMPWRSFLPLLRFFEVLLVFVVLLSISYICVRWRVKKNMKEPINGSGHQDQDGTKDGLCLQTVEDEEVVLDRDEVANG